jgi:hypothetical protein
MLFEYPIKPIATRPMVMQEESANGPPNLSTIPLHEMRIMTGTSNNSIKERLLRHWVIKSARSNELKTAEVFGIIVCMIIIY